MEHFDRELGGLVEDSDEVGELYEFDNWFKDPQDEELSIMGLHVAIENASDISYKLMKNAETQLIEIIKNIIQNSESIKFFGHELLNINANNIDEVFNSLYEVYDEIYDYCTEDQYKKFIEQFIIVDKEYNK